MTYYGAPEMAASFRTVRKNTIAIAQDIPEDKYTFRATPESWTVAETLAHIVAHGASAYEVHSERRMTHIELADFMALRQKEAELQKTLRTKAEILAALQREGNVLAGWLDSLTEEQLAERVTFPATVQPPSKSRFEMLLSVKEHEMHHRGQLMVLERLMGIVPHLTRDFQARMARNAPQTTTA